MKKFIPYGRQWIEEDDIESVNAVLRSDWLTTGPIVQQFEQVFADSVGAQYAVSVSNGTAALHAVTYAIGIRPGDEVIVSPMTFASSANCIVFQGGTPVFADVDPSTLLLDPAQVESKIGPRTKAIIAVDYAGHPCDYDFLAQIARRHNIVLVDDACHALGGQYKGRPVGSLADLNVFSLHPVKHITTGEGGVIATDSADFAQRMRIFRNHGITTDHHQREKKGSWFYEMVDLGYNYRLTDFQCALGLSQLRKLPRWIIRRQEIARCYDEAFSTIDAFSPLYRRQDVSHAYHLYVVQLDLSKIRASREEIFTALRAEGIGANVHYIPVHLHPFYRKKYNTGPGFCPIAEAAYERILSLPMFPRMTDHDLQYVISAVRKVVNRHRL
jgi:perosamine synthetase